MLQELYSETGAAAQDIVAEVAPQVNNVTKEDIAEAAVDRAEAIADSVAKTVEISQDEHTAITEACAQVIYAETVAELAREQACYSMECMFAEGGIMSKLKGAAKSTKGFVKVNKMEMGVGAAAGAAAGGIAGYAKARKAAKAKGLQPGTPEYKKFVAKYVAGGAAIGTAAGTAAGAGAGAFRNRKVFGKDGQKYGQWSGANWFGKGSASSVVANKRKIMASANKK